MGLSVTPNFVALLAQSLLLLLSKNSSTNCLFRRQAAAGIWSTESMAQEPVSSSVYSYKHQREKTIDIHDIFVKKSKFRVLLSYIGIIFLLANIYYSLAAKERVFLGSVWNILFSVLVARCLQYKPVKKESVVIMPAFGVQLEKHFWSGRVDRRFVPIGKILKPVLNECVTPVTCYWSLTLLLRDEDELMLVFRKLHPPVKMLVPIWKALCAAINSEDLRHSAVPQTNYSHEHD